MKQQSRMAGRLTLVVATVVILVVLSGCATLGRDLARDGAVTVERVSSTHAEVSHVHVHQAAAGMMVYGELTKLPAAPWTLPGHVEVQILDPHETVVDQMDTSYHRKDKRSHRVWFHVQVPAVPPPGSIVRVTHHPVGEHPFRLYPKTPSP